MKDCSININTKLRKYSRTSTYKYTVPLTVGIDRLVTMHVISSINRRAAAYFIKEEVFETFNFNIKWNM